MSHDPSPKSIFEVLITNSNYVRIHFMESEPKLVPHQNWLVQVRKVKYRVPIFLAELARPQTNWRKVSYFSLPTLVFYAANSVHYMKMIDLNECFSFTNGTFCSFILSVRGSYWINTYDIWQNNIAFYFMKFTES